MTLYPDAAHAAATSDRQATADLVLDIAAKQAAALIRDGRTNEAAAELERATRSAGRMLGGESPC